VAIVALALGGAAWWRRTTVVRVDFPTNNERGVNGYPARSYSTGDL
jgi:hypothetical protein